MTDNEMAGRQPLPDTWASRDYPVLRAVTKRFDEGASLVKTSEIEEDTGLTEEEVGRAAAALGRTGYVTLHESGNATYPWGFRDVMGKAYLVTGLHPDGDDALSQLVSALRQAADQQPDEGESNRLRAAADSLLNVGRGVMQGVLTAYLTGQIT